MRQSNQVKMRSTPVRPLALSSRIRFISQLTSCFFFLEGLDLRLVILGTSKIKVNVGDIDPIR